MRTQKEIRREHKHSLNISKHMADKNKSNKRIVKSKIFVSASFNNTLVTMTDEEGAVIVWGSSKLGIQRQEGPLHTRQLRQWTR